jgi:hypothetical protein
MAEGGTTLEYTPTWVVAAVCSAIVLISLIVERFLHLLGKVIHHSYFLPFLFFFILFFLYWIRLPCFVPVLISIIDLFCYIYAVQVIIFIFYPLICSYWRENTRNRSLKPYRKSKKVNHILIHDHYIHI